MPAMTSAASTLAIRNISSTPGRQHSVASQARKTLEVRHTGARPGPSVAMKWPACARLRAIERDRGRLVCPAMLVTRARSRLDARAARPDAVAVTEWTFGLRPEIPRRARAQAGGSRASGPRRARRRPRTELQGGPAGRPRETRPGDAPGIRHPGRGAAPQPRAARRARKTHRRAGEAPAPELAAAGFGP